MNIRDTEEYKNMTQSRFGQLTWKPAKSEEEQLAFWQYLVDTRAYTWLEGWFGRTAMSMIEDGVIERPEA